MDETDQIRVILEGLLDLLKSLSEQIKTLEERVTATDEKIDELLHPFSLDGLGVPSQYIKGLDNAEAE